MLRPIGYFIFLLATIHAWSQPSVLTTGDWYKLGVTANGIYKLDAAFLESLGINRASIDPRNLRVYGNAVTGMLPQANDAERPFDLLENAIFIEGEGDGSFDDADYLLFYAVGPDKQVWTPSGFDYEKNLYADTSYYFLTIGAQPGKRIGNKASLAGDGTVVNQSEEAIIYEEDENNLLSSGREWYGELFSSGERQRYSYDLTGINSDVQIVLSAVGQSSASNFFEISVNGSNAGSLAIGPIQTGPGSTYLVKAQAATDTFLIPQTSAVDIQLEYQPNSSSGRGFLDFFVVQYDRDLRIDGNAIAFRNRSAIGLLANYQVGDANSDVRIWDVSDPTNVRNQEFTLSGDLAIFQSQSSEVEEFIAFQGSDFQAPTTFESVSNQNLKANVSSDGIIISHPNFLPEANRLAAFHRQHDNLDVQVVTTFQVYNEFSSGRQDVSALRDYARYVYRTGGNLKYLLLFGDCSFDYKFREPGNTNFVPTYQSRNSFDPIFSHSSDDYFGFFEDTEGEWLESSSGDHTLEIGVGRIPAKSQEDAKAVVDKIIYYSTSPNALGKWRNELAYFADDGDNNIHGRHVEDLSRIIDTTYRPVSIDKLMLDAFDQEVGASRQSSPEATKALKAKIKQGAFAINYVGHGNERVWTAEEVLTRSMVRDLTNKNRLPIFVTATCEFGRYDDPAQVSGAEELLFNKNGGAIALLTTSRPVFASTNFSLNQAFHEQLFRTENGEFQRLGDIMRYTKNNGLAGPVNRNFTLLGDPMMMPAYPQLEIRINELEAEQDTLSALETVTYSGEILERGSLNSTFNGLVSVAVLDIEQTFKTQGQESNPFSYTLQNNALFRGEASVEDGEFSFSFVVPKNISYQFKQGKVSLYAWDESQNLDATGVSTNFVLGGTQQDVVANNEPPAIELFINDESFVNGATVGNSSLLIARLLDTDGLSITSSGLSQGLTLELDGETINMNEFYTSDIDSYQSGSLVYPIQDLAPGVYTARLTAYDVYNNRSQETVTFRVSDESFISVFDAIAYPNPVREQTTFSFTHDREEEDLRVDLWVYNAQGVLVSRSQTNFENSDRMINLTWEPKTIGGQRFNRGVYFYRLVIQSIFDGATKEISDRIVIVN